MADDDFDKALHEVLQNAQSRAVTLESIGKFAGKLGHDMNNVLGSILGCVELMKMKLNRMHPEGNPFEKQFKLIDASIRRGTDITTKIRAFSRPEAIEKQIFELEPVVASAIELIKKSGATNADIEFILEARPKVSASQFLITQILFNIFSNALEAMAKLEDRTLIVFLSEQEVKNHPDLKPGKYARVSVIDHGVGIKKEHRDKIFEPFFSTRKTGIGEAMGLGLAMAQDILRRLDGTLEFQSEQNRGTVVHMYLPAEAAGVSS